MTLSKKRKEKSPYRKKRLAADRDMWAAYGLKKPPKPRYVGLQGVLWFITSNLVRSQDFAKYRGLCVDGCGGRVEDWHNADCGHYQTASKASTRFDLQNLALQLKGCNAQQGNGDVIKSTGFAHEIDRRHGAGTAATIVEKSKVVGHLSDDWLKEQIEIRLALLSTDR